MRKKGSKLWKTEKVRIMNREKKAKNLTGRREGVQ